MKYDALVMSGQVETALESSGLPKSELGDFSGIDLGSLTTGDAMQICQGGPGGYKNKSPASLTYRAQIDALAVVFGNGMEPGDPESGYANPGGGPGWKEPRYGSIV